MHSRRLSYAPSYLIHCPQVSWRYVLGIKMECALISIILTWSRKLSLGGELPGSCKKGPKGLDDRARPFMVMGGAFMNSRGAYEWNGDHTRTIGLPR